MSEAHPGYRHSDSVVPARRRPRHLGDPQRTTTWLLVAPPLDLIGLHLPKAAIIRAVCLMDDAVDPSTRHFRPVAHNHSSRGLTRVCRYDPPPPPSSTGGAQPQPPTTWIPSAYRDSREKTACPHVNQRN